MDSTPTFPYFDSFDSSSFYLLIFEPSIETYGMDFSVLFDLREALEFYRGVKPCFSEFLLLAKKEL